MLAVHWYKWMITGDGSIIYLPWLYQTVKQTNKKK